MSIPTQPPPPPPCSDSWPPCPSSVDGPAIRHSLTLQSPLSPLSPPPPPPSPPSPPGKLVGLVVGVAGGGLIFVVGILILLFYWRRRRRRRMNIEDGVGKLHGDGQPPVHSQLSSSISGSYASERPPPAQSTAGIFTYEVLEMATNNFSPDKFLGQGGFGFVYEGVLPNGKHVAIKQLKAGSVEGEVEFWAEVDVVARINHKHLVSLEGHCNTRDQKLLVYEFVPNNTLAFHLHGNGRPTMNWPTRMKIALGSARGLAYLHEDCQPKIIHRDIKPANILLQLDFEAKLADFGLAKFCPNTHVSTRIIGTDGYIAPEYRNTGKLTYKSDVYSFGVVLLELISGRPAIDKNEPGYNIVTWATTLLPQALENGNFTDLVDPRLQNDYHQSEMARMVACAAACVRQSDPHRPGMGQIVRALEGNIPLNDLYKGLTPGQSPVQHRVEHNKDLWKEFQKLARIESEGYGPPPERSGPSNYLGHFQCISSEEGEQTRLIGPRPTTSQPSNSFVPL